jgi:hypothetical protein
VSGLAPDHEALIDLICPPYERSQIRSGHIGPVIGAHGGPRVTGFCFARPK